MSDEETKKKYVCSICGKGPDDKQAPIAITNINPIGVPALWVCDKDLNKETQ